MDEFAVVTIGTFTDSGGVYRTWAVERVRVEALAADLGPPDQERIQTADELEASNAMVDSFEAPPLTRRDFTEL